MNVNLKFIALLLIKFFFANFTLFTRFSLSTLLLIYSTESESRSVLPSPYFTIVAQHTGSIRHKPAGWSNSQSYILITSFFFGFELHNGLALKYLYKPNNEQNSFSENAFLVKLPQSLNSNGNVLPETMHFKFSVSCCRRMFQKRSSCPANIYGRKTIICTVSLYV